MLITRISPLTGKKNTMDLDITIKQLKIWQKGELIQRVMPNLSSDEREFLISGLMPGEFEELFSEEDDLVNDKFGNEEYEEEPF